MRICRQRRIIPGSPRSRRQHDQPIRPAGHGKGDARLKVIRRSARARGGGHLPPPWRGLPVSHAGHLVAPTARDGSDRGMPHGGVRRPRRKVRGLRPLRIAYNSCRDRHCPKCQGSARAAWLAERQAELLPVPYFHVVFTLPAPTAEIAFQNKAVGLCDPVQGRRRDAEQNRRRSEASRRRDRLHRHAPYLGPEPAASPARSLPRPRRRRVPGRKALDCLPTGLLPAGTCPLTAVPPAVSGKPEGGLRVRQVSLLRRAGRACCRIGLRPPPQRIAVTSVKVVEIGVEFEVAIGHAAKGGSLLGSASSGGGVSSAIPSICM